MVRPLYDELNDLTLVQLQNLRQEWFTDARNAGKFRKLARVARELGQQVSDADSRFEWRSRNAMVVILLDETQKYIVVRYLGKVVVDTRADQKLFIPDPDGWEDIIKNDVQAAIQREQRRSETSNRQRRVNLVSLLSLPERDEQ